MFWDLRLRKECNATIQRLLNKFIKIENYFKKVVDKSQPALYTNKVGCDESF